MNCKQVGLSKTNIAAYRSAATTIAIVCALAASSFGQITVASPPIIPPSPSLLKSPHLSQDVAAHPPASATRLAAAPLSPGAPAPPPSTTQIIDLRQAAISSTSKGGVAALCARPT